MSGVYVTCPSCGGRRVNEDICSSCGGSGYRAGEKCRSCTHGRVVTKCLYCNGTGTVRKD